MQSDEAHAIFRARGTQNGGAIPRDPGLVGLRAAVSVTQVAL